MDVSFLVNLNPLISFRIVNIKRKLLVNWWKQSTKNGVGFLTSLTRRANTIILRNIKLVSFVIFSHNFDILQVKNYKKGLRKTRNRTRESLIAESFKDSRKKKKSFISCMLINSVLLHLCLRCAVSFNSKTKQLIESLLDFNIGLEIRL